MDKKEALDIWKHALENRSSVDEKQFQSAMEWMAGNKDTAYIVLNSDDMMKGRPYEGKLLETAFRTAAQGNDPQNVFAAMQNSALLNGKPYKDEILDTIFHKAANDPIAASLVLNHAALLNGKPYKDEVLDAAFHTAAKSPHFVLSSVMKNSALLEGKSYKDEVLHAAFLNAATGPEAYEVLQYSAALKGKPYEAEIRGYVAASERSAQGIDAELNRQHERPDAERFAMLKNLDASQDFNLITLGRSEAYTSTYRGVLDDMLHKLDASHQKLTDVLSPEQTDRMGVFLEAAASYNRMNDALRVIPEEQLPGIIHNLGNKAAESSDLSYSATMLTMMTALKGSPDLRHQLEEEVKSRYESAKTPEEKDKFGLIASAYGKNNAETVSQDMKAFYLGMSQNPRYAMPEMSTIGRGKLIDKNGVDNQLMVFANDDDGKSSFASFERTYAGKKDWKTEDKGNYVLVESTNASGAPVRIYANKPDHFEDGVAAIKQDVARGQGQDSPSFQMFVARGHSYHADEFLPLIDKDMNLIYLGSCGGYNNLGTALKESPDAQIVSTQQTGTMNVNDPMLFSINESIRTQGSVDWQQQQKVLNNLGSSDKEAYLLPNRNIAAMMLMQYLKLLEQDTHQKQQKKAQDHPPADPVQHAALQARQVMGEQQPVDTHASALAPPPLARNAEPSSVRARV